MSRNGGYHEEDSDEDQVLYLDYHQAGEESIVAASRASVKDKKLPKYKPLFQHKKYKGDVRSYTHLDTVGSIYTVVLRNCAVLFILHCSLRK